MRWVTGLTEHRFREDIFDFACLRGGDYEDEDSKYFCEFVDDGQLDLHEFKFNISFKTELNINKYLNQKFNLLYLTLYLTD